MSRLHGLLYNGKQLLAQLLQVYLMTQRGTEARHNLGRVILTPVEPAIYQLLHAPAQGLKQRGNEQGGDDKNHWIARSEEAGQ